MQARKDRKARAEAERKRKAKMVERIVIYGGSVIIVTIMLGITVVIILAKQGRL